MTTTPQNIGFIGLGIMGAPMAGHLLDAGHQLFVNTRSKVPEPFIAEGKAEICASPPKWRARPTVIFIMVPDTPDVEKVLFGENGTRRGLRA
jgi:2-hydroxy-3-oxopropionate reductase